MGEWTEGLGRSWGHSKNPSISVRASWGTGRIIFMTWGRGIWRVKAGVHWPLQVHPGASSGSGLGASQLFRPVHVHAQLLPGVKSQ